MPLGVFLRGAFTASYERLKGEFQLFVHPEEGEGAVSDLFPLLVDDPGLIDGDRFSTLDFKGFGGQAVTHLCAPHEVEGGVDGDGHKTMGAHGEAAGVVRHGEVKTSVGNAQRVGVLRRHGFHGPCIAGPQLLHRDSNPLAEGVMSVVIVHQGLQVHRIPPESFLGRLYPVFAGTSIFTLANSGRSFL